MLRLFFALQPTPRQCAALVDSAAPWIARLEGQHVPAENLHATLCFIGAVAPGQLEPLCTVAASLRGRHVDLCFDTLEYWRKPRVLCATATEDANNAPARELAHRLATMTTAAGFAPDLKPFRPHLTLGKKIQPACATQCPWPQPLAPTMHMHCERFVLMQSHRGESGSIYSVVNSWPLYGSDTD